MPLGGMEVFAERAGSYLHPNGLFASLWKDWEDRLDFSFQSPKLGRAPQWRGCQGSGTSGARLVLAVATEGAALGARAGTHRGLESASRRGLGRSQSRAVGCRGQTSSP